MGTLLPFPHFFLLELDRTAVSLLPQSQGNATGNDGKQTSNTCLIPNMSPKTHIHQFGLRKVSLSLYLTDKGMEFSTIEGALCNQTRFSKLLAKCSVSGVFLISSLVGHINFA